MSGKPFAHGNTSCRFMNCCSKCLKHNDTLDVYVTWKSLFGILNHSLSFVILSGNLNTVT